MRVFRTAVSAALLIAASFGLPRAVLPAPNPSLAELLAGYARAADDPGVAPVRRFEARGSVSGGHLAGEFHIWEDGDRARQDENLGPRKETTLRLGDRVFYQNADGNVREFTGVMLRRDRTERFIDSGDFARAPERCIARGRTTLAGRAAYALDVTAPGGELQTLYLDAQTFLPLRIAYDDDDGRMTIDLTDWRTVDGHRFPFRAVISDGDHDFDVTQTTETLGTGAPVAAEVFRPLVARTIEMAAPETLRLIARQGHLFVPVTIAGHRYTFLVDTGAQNILLDTHVSRELGLSQSGALEASGAQRVGGLQVAKLDALGIGDGVMRDLVVTTLDLGRSTGGVFPIDGILGYPFFAEATVTLDPAHATMTFGPPGSFTPPGTKMTIETDRAFPEARFRINGALEVPFLVDTGNAGEILLYKPFMDRHPGFVPPSVTATRRSYGIGGATASYSSTLDAIELAGSTIYHAQAEVMLATRGAFADRFDAGNVGLGVLKNFIVTFDESANALYLERGVDFNDGRTRV
jgi:predicted aspartyl protease